MGELDEAIREHLELKRRRGADPAEVAREEQEALSPVTRGHPIVVPEQLEHESGDEPVQNGGPAQHEPATEPPHDEPPHDESPGDATQEFRVEDPASGDWLVDDEE
jgi:hypothetical protein